MWEVCLPASSSSSSPNSRNKQGRLQFRRERESKQAVPAGEGGGGDWSGRQDPDGARDTHTRARLGTDAPTLTHSYTLGLVPVYRPPCGDTQTPSANSANPQNTPWTHMEIQALALTPHPPTNRTVWAPDSSEGGEENTGRKDSRQHRGCAAKALGAGASLPHSFPKPSKSRQHWSSCQGPCQLPTLPKPLPPERGVGCWASGDNPVYSSQG